MKPKNERLGLRAVAIIPTRNEAGTIGDLVFELLSVGISVIVVDDQSEDNTARIALSSGAQVISNPYRLGLAESIMAGWRLATHAGYSYIVQMDAGGSHQVYDVLGMLTTLEGDTGAVIGAIIGSRFMRGSSYTGGRTWRAISSRIMALLCSAKSGRYHTDWTSGLRVFRAEVIRSLLVDQATTHPLTARRHGWQMQVLHFLEGTFWNVREYPIHYTAGASSFNRSAAIEAMRVLLSMTRLSKGWRLWT